MTTMSEKVDQESTPTLFTPFTMRSLTVRNRVGVSPMCMFACEDKTGVVTDWHVVHYGQFAIGGAGLIIAEATAVTAEGRVTPDDAGLWDDSHIPAWRRVTDAVHRAGSAIAVQLAHAGRKASSYPGLPTHPKSHRGSVPIHLGGWEAIGASGAAFGRYAPPRVATGEEVHAILDAFQAAARRAVLAGFDAIELHGAHGYLLHEFLSPVTNDRDDPWGHERTALLERAVSAVRLVIPPTMPLIVRLSVDDVAVQGLTAEDSARFAVRLQGLGVDLIDCSSGGLVEGVEYRPFPGYQVPGSFTVRSAGVATAAVGLISDPAHADQIVRDGQADIVLMGRGMLRDPHWARRAERELTGAATMEPRYYRAYR